MTGIDFIRDLAVVMAVAGVAGWISQRLRLSVVVGYLIAGILIGPYALPIPLVSDTDRIQILANVGLVFLMFSIGNGLSVRRLRRLGPPLLIATGLGAVFVFTTWKFLAGILGFNHVESLFLAGMFVCSSSAIIGKVLQEFGFLHLKFGQLAMGVTVMEDMVAIVTLTVLISYAGVEQGTVLEALGVFGAFVVVLGITGLILLPRILGFLSRHVGSELLTLMVVAVLFGLALLAHEAGYSLALGAFVMGAIVAETDQRAQIERNFDGLRYVFSAVFFVAIGMMIDISVLKEIWKMILLISVLTIGIRIFGLTTSYLLTGNTTHNSIRAGLTVTPMGEFSFIIAQGGIMAAVVPESFYAIGVGVSLLTALTLPALVLSSDRIAALAIRIEPTFVRNGIERYQNFLTSFSALLRENAVWVRGRKSLIQLGLALFFLGGLILPAGHLNTELVGLFGDDFLFPNGTSIIFWTILILLVLIPLTVIWHNISTLGKMIGDVFRNDRERGNTAPVLVETTFRILGLIAVGIFVVNLLPLGVEVAWISGAILVAGMIALLFFRTRLRRMHEQLELELEGMLTAPPRDEKQMPSWLNRPDEWALNVNECTLPDGAVSAGKTIGELGLRQRFGSSIVAIDRHGYFMGNPDSSTVLFPGDRLLLLGNPQEISQARKVLEASDPEAAASSEFADVGMETLPVPEKSPHVDSSLAELDISRVTGVQIAGIKRNGLHRLNPRAEERLAVGDELLVLGRPDQVRKLRLWLEG